MPVGLFISSELGWYLSKPSLLRSEVAYAAAHLASSSADIDCAIVFFIQYLVLLAGKLGIEPRFTGPEPVVLPLYYSPTDMAATMGFEPTISSLTGKRFKPLSYAANGIVFGRLSFPTTV